MDFSNLCLLQIQLPTFKMEIMFHNTIRWTDEHIKGCDGFCTLKMLHKYAAVELNAGGTLEANDGLT